jgi:DNA polymerase-1
VADQLTAEPQIKTVYLIDASIYIFQAHFSPYTECYDRDNKDLSAVYGFTRFLLQFINRIKPSHIGIARDESLFSGFRHQLCPNYKSNRELPDENLKTQLDACALVCDAMGLANFASRVYEADDILGTLATRISKLENPQRAICIVSKDKDLAQLLINERNYLWDFSGNRKRNRHDVFNEYGVFPEQFPDYLGLVGDSVDVISGVPGVGPVKAKALLGEFSSLEAIYENLESIGDLKFRGAKGLPPVLANNLAKAQLSKVLATIDCDVSEANESFSTTRYEDLEVGSPDQLGFRSLLRDLNFQQAESESLLYQFEKVFKIA